MTSHDGLPPEGLSLTSNNLFIVDVNVDRLSGSNPERRAFTDIEAAVEFIDGRAALFNAFLAPIGLGTDAMFYGLVVEALKSRTSDAIALRFASAPEVTLTCGAAMPGATFEPFYRIYPGRTR
ncbi:hypothetical protein [Roseateles sp. L2-2]|uniref:hypothetical protein n=1 Tax=Roseateles sp. L2-2 TaxID=3422597 RepID=UPI003D36CC00